MGKERASVWSLFFSGLVGFFVRALMWWVRRNRTSTVYGLTKHAFVTHHSKYEVFRPLFLSSSDFRTDLPLDFLQTEICI
jgi:hypothetical protein